MMLFLLFLSYAIILSVVLALAGHRSQTAGSNGVCRHHPARVLIIGATGGTGRQLVTQALERRYVVTALVRDPSRLKVDHPQLTVMQGDVLDESSVEAAMRGQEAVLCALGHKRFFYPSRILSEGTRNILRVMETNGVARLRMIARSNAEWVIVRPGVLTNGEKRGHSRQGSRVGSFFFTVRISRADVADFMLNQLASDTYLRTAPGVCW